MKDYFESWVESSRDDEQKAFRQAVHTIIVAISKSDELSKSMVMKGGVLLAVRYGSTRYTSDIDFSTETLYRDFDKDDFLSKLNEGIVGAVDELDYGLDCVVQSHEVRPRSDQASFPTLKMKVGYAYQGSKEHKHLLAGSAIKVVQIDYSFNERTNQIEYLNLSNHAELATYGLEDLVAEKYRAIIQQPSRDRYRRQDVYDLHLLFRTVGKISEETQKKILETVLEKSKSRGLEIDIDSLDSGDVIRRSKAEYDELSAEIEGELPTFEEVYSCAKEFYRNLPW